MTFTSFSFLLYFLPFVVILYYALQTETKRNIWLLLFSMLFCFWNNILIDVLLLSVFSYLVGQALLLPKKRGNNALIFFAVFVMLSPFIINKLTAHHVPLGASFYLFSSISYLIDSKNHKQKNFLSCLLYILLFSKLLSGPIVLFKDFESQIKNRKTSLEDFSYNIQRLIIGLFKKLMIANTLAGPVNLIFQTPVTEMSMPTLWFGALFYTFQIYFDFSAYSDMAIATAGIFGFKFKENFNFPYLSKSVSEFWTRWHISLSQWFKEYIYFPLGGNRKGKVRWIFNIWVVFIICGLWHGFKSTFLLWGIYQAVFVSLDKLLFRIPNKYCSIIFTFFLTVIGWVIFRSDTLHYAGTYLKGMFGLLKLTPDFGAQYFISNFSFIIFAIAVIFSFIDLRFIYSLKNNWLILIRSICVLILFLLDLALLTVSSYNSFIYFNF